MGRRKNPPVHYEHSIVERGEPQPLSPDQRQKLVSHFARLLEAAWRRRHEQEPSAAPTDLAVREPLETSRRRKR